PTHLPPLSLHDALPISTGRGTGLGLSISLGIVREHEGRIWAENAPGGGARFVIVLPLIRPRRTGEFPVVPAAGGGGQRLRLLVVDRKSTRLNSSHQIIS